MSESTPTGNAANTAPAIALSLGGNPRRGQRALRLARANLLGAICLTILIVIAAIAMAAPVIAPSDPLATSMERLQSPSWSHPLGTDQLGRDVLSRIIYGSRASLTIAATVVLIGGGLAATIGIVTTYVGGVLDYAWQRIVDLAMAIPGLVLLLSILIVLGPSLTNLIIVLALRLSISNTRYIRSATLSILQADYILAARAIGASDIRTMFRYIAPNVVPLAIVVVSLEVGTTIIVESSLSFLGYGVPPPTPTWGSMLGRDGRLYFPIAPWLLLAPGIALTLVVYCVNVFGDTLRDVLDPRLRGSAMAKIEG